MRLPRRAMSIGAGTLLGLGALFVGFHQLAVKHFNLLKHPSREPVSLLAERIQQGTEQLRFESRAGYLRSLLEALDLPVESQLAVFSKSSLQAERIGPKNPRTIFFNDSTAVAWVRGGFIVTGIRRSRAGRCFLLT